VEGAAMASFFRFVPAAAMTYAGGWRSVELVSEGTPERWRWRRRRWLLQPVLCRIFRVVCRRSRTTAYGVSSRPAEPLRN